MDWRSVDRLKLVININPIYSKSIIVFKKFKKLTCRASIGDWDKSEDEGELKNHFEAWFLWYFRGLYILKICNKSSILFVKLVRQIDILQALLLFFMFFFDIFYSLIFFQILFPLLIVMAIPGPPTLSGNDFCVFVSTHIYDFKDRNSSSNVLQYSFKILSELSFRR